jgi:hypothetical protein
MEKPAALRLLPVAYAIAIALDDEDCDHDRIASALGVDRNSVPGLVSLARAKLAALEASPDDEAIETGSSLRGRADSGPHTVERH